MNLERLPPSIFGRLHAIGDAAHPIGQERPIDETRPDIERIDQVAIEPLEAPGLIGMDDPILIVVASSPR